MEDLEGLTGLRRTKGGSNDTEPAYIIERRHCGRWVLCVALSLTVAGLMVWRSDAMLRRVSPKLAARRAQLRLKEHSAHARFTKLGQELEQHLEMDMREREVALKLRARLRALEKTHRANVTRALEAAAIGAEDFSFEARDAVRPYLDGAVDSLFAELQRVLEQRIVSPMMASSSAAYERHKELHDEVLRELERDRTERESFLRRKRNADGDHDGDGFAEDANLDGVEDHRWIDEFDEEAAERRDEEWRRDVLANFIDSFERHFNDTAMREDGLDPHATLRVESKLYLQLIELRDELGGDDFYDASSNHSAPSISWHDAELELAKLKPQLDAARCHEFEPSPPPSDDEFDYMQLHNVERYLDDMIWHAKLNQKRAEIEGHIKDYLQDHLKPMSFLEILEHYEGEDIFPSFWLFHAGGPYDDFAYGDW
mmetsp:Transcript_15946/g.49970  ORF Transcript_15946/g.49970 Transcript_15946/m.49970 type:complete len:427 (-) Transcript_15946:323-1603(-)